MTFEERPRTSYRDHCQIDFQQGIGFLVQALSKIENFEIFHETKNDYSIKK